MIAMKMCGKCKEIMGTACSRCGLCTACCKCKRGRGRPKEVEDAVMTSIIVPTAMLEQVRVLARDLQTSQSDLWRLAMSEYLRWAD